MMSPPIDYNLVPRLMMLALIVALAQLWVHHHLGWGGDTPWAAGIVFVVTFVEEFVGYLLPKEMKEALETQVKQKLLPALTGRVARSEEHTSELQSLAYLVCRLLLEKKKKQNS